VCRSRWTVTRFAFNEGHVLAAVADMIPQMYWTPLNGEPLALALGNRKMTVTPRGFASQAFQSGTAAWRGCSAPAPLRFTLRGRRPQERRSSASGIVISEKRSPRLHRHQHERMVRRPNPGALILCGQQGIDLGMCVKSARGSRESFTRNGAHALDLRRMRRKRGKCGEMKTEKARVGGRSNAGTASHAQSMVPSPGDRENRDTRGASICRSQRSGALMRHVLGELQEVPRTEHVSR